MYCPNCGKQLPDGVKFCTGCGTALAGPAPAPAPEPEPRYTAPRPEPAPEKKSRAGLIVGVIAAIAALAAGAFLIAPRLSAGGNQTGAAMDGGNQTETAADSGGQAETAADGGLSMLNYVQPTALGNDPLSFTFELDGVLYQLPAPISVFEDNGWVLEEDKYAPDELDPGATWPSMEIRKGNTLCAVSLHNYSDSPAPLKNCPVVEFSAGYVYTASSLERGAISTGETTMLLPSGVATGMSWTELRATADMWKSIYGVEPVERDDGDDIFTDMCVYLDPDAGEDQHRDYITVRYDLWEEAVYTLIVHAETMTHDRPAAADMPALSYEQLLANRGIAHEPVIPEGAAGDVTSLAEFIRQSIFGRDTVVCGDYVHTDDLVTACTVTYYTDAAGLSENRIQQMQQAAEDLIAQYEGYPNASVSYGVQDQEGGSFFVCTCQFLGLDQADPSTLTALGFDSQSLTKNEQQDMSRGALKKQ